MKHIIYSLALASIALFSCKDDSGITAEKDSLPPGKISNISSTSDFGEIALKWTVPSDEDFSHTLVVYTNNGKSDTLKTKSSSITIDGFGAESPVEFSLIAVDRAGNKSAAELITATPGAPPCNSVFGSIEAKPDYGAATIVWTNTTGKVVRISVKHIDDNAVEQISSKNSDKAVDSFSVALLNAQNIRIAVIYGTTELSKDEYIVPLRRPINKNMWTVDSFSSEEATGENNGNNGRAIHAIDGNFDTFWHTQWKNSYSPTLPNYLVYNLGKRSDISWIKVTQRNGNKSLQTVEILMSNDNVTFTLAGTLNFPDAGGGAQEIAFDPPEGGLYLKINMPNSRHGDRHSFIAEIEVQGLRDY
ncbi:MAG: DUF4959 domain-containing protein [Prevotellaceae bacterium]|nr:DUF4959 domain-containing protein [Prevotellaceae bacterium]